MSYSKPLQSPDDDSKRLIIEALGEQHTYGFDVDSIFWVESERKWIIIEFLKTDRSNLSPYDSHPQRYWKKNWRKFAKLWHLVSSLKKGGYEAELYLVNYETKEHARANGRDERLFRIMRVINLTEGEEGAIQTDDILKTDFNGFQSWYKDINASVTTGKKKPPTPPTKP